jgi:hypothetical protein
MSRLIKSANNGMWMCYNLPIIGGLVVEKNYTTMMSKKFVKSKLSV